MVCINKTIFQKTIETSLDLDSRLMPCPSSENTSFINWIVSSV